MCSAYFRKGAEEPCCNDLIIFVSLLGLEGHAVRSEVRRSAEQAQTLTLVFTKSRRSGMLYTERGIGTLAGYSSEHGTLTCRHHCPCFVFVGRRGNVLRVSISEGFKPCIHTVAFCWRSSSPKMSLLYRMTSRIKLWCLPLCLRAQ